MKAEKLLDCKQYLLLSNQTKDQARITFERTTPTIKSAVETETQFGQTNSTEVEISPNKKSLDAKDEKFMGEFYNNSRLHLISTMKSDFKKYVNQLRNENKDMVFPKRQTLLLLSDTRCDSSDYCNRNKIMHIDMDCFFVSVSLRNYPDARGRPIGVAHAKGNKSDGTESWSEIASCSYEAREKGVKNGMFVGPAKNLCPELMIIPYDFEGYQAVAKVLYDTVANYTLDIQAVSCDEMLVDLSSLINAVDGIDILSFCEELRKEIYNSTNCTASIGLGPNTLLAKLATKKAKPNGVHGFTGKLTVL